MGSLNDFGNPVIEVMHNFQDWATIQTSHVATSGSSLSVVENDNEGKPQEGSEGSWEVLDHVPLIEVPAELNWFPDPFKGGDGVISLATFDLAAEQIHFEAYSPLLNGYIRKTAESQGQWATDFTVPLLTSRITSISRSS